jgi:hypothetical protein
MIGRGNSREAEVTGGKHRRATVVPIRPGVLATIMDDPAAAQRVRPTITYCSGEVNHCPGCGRSQWLVGRTTAECAFCATALPLDR